MNWQYEKLNGFHVELSTKCQAACPGCPRFLRNSTNVDPLIPQVDISIDQFKKWFPLDLVQRTISWIFCGTHGDPLSCNDLYEILEYICLNSDANIQINTNGGLRNYEYYTRIGRLFVSSLARNDIRREITFSIDGLEDTNHIYRRNVVWKNVWRNLFAYTETGAHAQWDFLQFKHNMHQISEARLLAESMGIQFNLKNPFGLENQSMPVLDKDFNVVYAIRHASNNNFPIYTPASDDWFPPRPQLTKREGTIECNSFRTGPPPYHETEMQELYIDVLGRVQPCCFVGNKMQGPMHTSESREVREIQGLQGVSNNLNYFSLKDIIENNVLKIYSDSWKDKTVYQCYLQCGKNKDKQRYIDKLFVKDE